MKKPKQKYQKTRINEEIRARELQVIDEEQGNRGVMSLEEAQEKARQQGLDLIEISPKAEPPVAKITDYGKYQYDQKKKQREAKAKQQTTETKNIQVKIGTSEHDLELKAKQASKWLSEGHRVKVDLFLAGRAKYSDMEFKKDRLQRVLNLITEDYRIAEEPKKSPKGLTTIIERGSGKKS